MRRPIPCPDRDGDGRISVIAVELGRHVERDHVAVAQHS